MKTSTPVRVRAQQSDCENAKCNASIITVALIGRKSCMVKALNKKVLLIKDLEMMILKNNKMLFCSF